LYKREELCYHHPKPQKGKDPKEKKKGDKNSSKPQDQTQEIPQRIITNTYVAPPNPPNPPVAAGAAGWPNPPAAGAPNVDGVGCCCVWAPGLIYWGKVWFGGKRD